MDAATKLVLIALLCIVPVGLLSWRDYRRLKRARRERRGRDATDVLEQEAAWRRDWSVTLKMGLTGVVLAVVFYFRPDIDFPDISRRDLRVVAMIAGLLVTAWILWRHPPQDA